MAQVTTNDFDKKASAFKTVATNLTFKTKDGEEVTKSFNDVFNPNASGSQIKVGKLGMFKGFVQRLTLMKRNAGTDLEESVPTAWVDCVFENGLVSSNQILRGLGSRPTGMTRDEWKKQIEEFKDFTPIAPTFNELEDMTVGELSNLEVLAVLEFPCDENQKYDPDGDRTIRRVLVGKTITPTKASK